MVAHTLMVSGVVVALIGLIGGSSATPNTWDCDSRGRRTQPLTPAEESWSAVTLVGLALFVVGVMVWAFGG